jgi:hypothetical protein
MAVMMLNFKSVNVRSVATGFTVQNMSLVHFLITVIQVCSQGGLSRYNVSIKNVDAPTRNLQNIKDKHAYQHAKKV